MWVFGGGEVHVVGAGHDSQGPLGLGEVSGEDDDGDVAGVGRVGAQGDVGAAECDGDGRAGAVGPPEIFSGCSALRMGLRVPRSR